jgi:succinate dehydrogenase/fumarate reductase flavoprotein subunit
MLEEIKAGKGPIYMHTQEVLDSRAKEEIGWEDFLDMTISQSVVWASQNIDPKEKPWNSSLPSLMSWARTPHVPGRGPAGLKMWRPTNTSGATTG